MINRVLIRIKVVQILYSYLLTRSEFKIEAAPETTSRDRKYAYTVYVDTLLLLLQLSGYEVQGPSHLFPLPEAKKNKHLHDNRVARSLSQNDTIRGIILRGNDRIATFDEILPALYDKVLASSIYRSYSRMRKRDLAEDVKLWSALVPTVIARDETLLAVLRQNPDFTLRGFEMGMDMVEDTLKKFSDNRSLLSEARSSLDRSLDKAYELYHSLLMLPLEITRFEDERLEAGRNKYLPTPDDLNPNTRFVENAFVVSLADNESFQAYLNDHPITWAGEPMLLRELLDKIKESEIYKTYMEAPATDYATDCDFWRNIMRSVILPSDALAEVLEESSVFWNDDIDIMGTFVIKTIKQFARSGGEDTVALLPKFKDEEDAQFGATLFDLAVENREEYRELIDRFINQEQWDSERLAFMDIVILITAIAELLNFPLIPVPVTLNEYIEIANSYSTPKSGQFINGILYSVINYLKSEGRLDKNL